MSSTLAIWLDYLGTSIVNLRARTDSALKFTNLILNPYVFRYVSAKLGLAPVFFPGELLSTNTHIAGGYSVVAPMMGTGEPTDFASYKRKKKGICFQFIFLKNR